MSTRVQFRAGMRYAKNHDVYEIPHVVEHLAFGANAKYKDKRFKGPHADVDAIYLTREELDRIIAVPARRLSARMQLARDIFLIGVWTAQRVSDYNYLRPEDIHTTIRRWVDDIPDPSHPGKTVSVIREKEITYIDIRQKKTGAKVSIPCSTELKRILEKYGGAIPHLPDQELNRHIKEIGRLAGLTEPVQPSCTSPASTSMIS